MWEADVINKEEDQESYAVLEDGHCLTEEKELASAMEIDGYLFVFGGLIAKASLSKSKK